jgi:hypothetical protein
MADDKLSPPEDPSGVKPTQENPVVEKDPEVLAEVIKNRIWHLKLERWMETAKAIGFFLQTFKAEAVSLMSGLGTLVVGWFQLKKWVIQGHKETKSFSHQGASFPKAKETRKRMESSEGQGYGSGSGRVGASRQEPVQMDPPPPPFGELVLDPTAGSLPGKLQTMFTDPMTYVPVLTLLVFIWSSWKAWLKRKAKQAEGGK